MKKFICALFIFLQTCAFANAEALTFLNKTYELTNIQKNSSNYINVYMNSANDKIIIYYLPKEESEFDYINDFISNLTNNPKFNLISFYPEINTFSFGIISKQKESNFIEYNIMKCQNDKKRGIYVVHFIHRYPFSDQESFKQAFQDCMKNNLQYVDALLKIQIPKIIKKK